MAERDTCGSCVYAAAQDFADEKRRSFITCTQPDLLRKRRARGMATCFSRSNQACKKFIRREKQ